MTRARRGLGAVAGVAVLAAALTGCQFVGDVVEGQRLSSERLAADSALRQLTAELADVDQVASAVYDFDAGDVASTPSLAVEFTGAGFAAWHEVASRIEVAGRTDALRDHPVSVGFASPTVGSSFDSQYGAPWLSEDALAIAADAATAFAGGHAMVSGASETSAFITVDVDEAADDLLFRVADDPLLLQLAERARVGQHWLSLSTDGLEITGTPSPELLSWAHGVLASGVPALVMAAEPAEPQDEWVTVSLASGDQGSSISASWSGAAEPGAGGSAWEGFVAAVRAGPVGSADGCVPVFLSFSWPGLGSSASVAATCGDPGPAPGDPDRPSLTVLRDALAAEGVVPEDLGFVLS